MTADREQVRRDALRRSLVAALNGHSVSPKTCGAILARWDALLAELKQAEQDRQRVEAHHDNIAALLVQADARLASVPALVEAALQVLDSTTSDEVHKEARRSLVEALTVYEQSQGKP